MKKVLFIVVLFSASVPLQAHIWTVANNSSVPINVYFDFVLPYKSTTKNLNPGSYYTTTNPTIAGLHHITISSDGRPITTLYSSDLESYANWQGKNCEPGEDGNPSEYGYEFAVIDCVDSSNPENNTFQVVSFSGIPSVPIDQQKLICDYTCPNFKPPVEHKLALKK